jgi:hypothetical protein
VRGGLYAPYVLNRYTRPVNGPGRQATIYWVVSAKGIRIRKAGRARRIIMQIGSAPLSTSYRLPPQHRDFGVVLDQRLDLLGRPAFAALKQAFGNRSALSPAGPAAGTRIATSQSSVCFICRGHDVAERAQGGWSHYPGTTE